MEQKILIVEDERVVAMDIQNLLGKLKYQAVGIAASAEEAIAKCEELSPNLVLMDIRLKGETDGITAAAEIKERFEIPVIYLTAHADERTLERAKVTEPYGYVLKPFDAIELRVAIELALYKHAGSRGNVEETNVRVQSETPIAALSAYVSELQALKELSQVPRDSLNRLLANAELRKLKPGELLAFEGDSRDFGFLTISGRIALFKSSLSGRELIVELLNPWELFGLAIAVEEQPFTFSARAQIASEVLVIPKQDLISLLEKEHQVYRHFIKLITERLARSHDLSRGLAHDKVDIRIASALLAAVPRDEALEGGLVHITRKELAEIAGTTVETAIRITKSMEREQLLDLTKNGCVKIMNLDHLQAFAESEL
jgi:CRP-like cAMP-binding protein/AmiR/NasT family two-component response regulator